MSLLSTASSDLTGLYSIFGDPLDQAPQANFVQPTEVPEPYRGLLAHDSHMTVTMEKFYGAPVNVVVLQSLHEGNHYARKILLTNSRTGEVVQFGIMRFNFSWCSDEVRDKILAGNIPLGRILIEHDVLRRISTHALMAIKPNEEIRRHFKIETNNGAGVVYGRLATIFCNEEPAVNLLEVAAPVHGESKE